MLLVKVHVWMVHGCLTQIVISRSTWSMLAAVGRMGREMWVRGQAQAQTQTQADDVVQVEHVCEGTRQ